MKNIELVQIGSNDLRIRYAREMPNKKIIHYISSLPGIISDSQEVVSSIKQLIEKEEGESVEISVTNGMVNATKIADLTDTVFTSRKDKNLLKALLRMKSKSILHQRIIPSKHYVLFSFLNSIIDKINNFTVHVLNNWIVKRKGLEDIASIEIGTYFPPGIEKTIDKELITPMPYFGYRAHVRHVDPVMYLCVSCTENNVGMAIQALKDDLTVMNKKKLILGHLTMPSIMPLANTIGIKEKFYAIFCFVVPDTYRLRLLTGHNPITDSIEEEYKKIGVKYSTKEGEIKYLENNDPNTIYEIREVNLENKDYKNQVENAHLDAIPRINKAADATRDLIRQLEVSSGLLLVDKTEIINE